MASVHDLEKLSFGAPAAERDSALGKYFVESEPFLLFQQRKKTIVLGNRGSGKSALFRVLADRARGTGTLVIALSPDNYSYEMLCKVLRSEKEGAWAKQGAFASAWKYLILTLVMKELSHHGAKLKTGDAGKIYEFLRDHFKGEEQNPISVLVSYLKRLEGIKIGPYEAGLKTRELDHLYKLDELTPLMAPLKRLLGRQRVHVFIDELDKGWDNSEDARAFVSGLFQAANSLNELSEDLTVYVSLRQELHDSIPALYEDAQKYTDVIHTLQWDEAALLEVIAKRIRYCLESLSTFSDLDAWNTVFAPILQYRQTKSFNYVVDRTLYRPREIIQFCAAALEEARDGKAAPIDYSVISVAELRYSDSRVKDIAAEYRFQYPDLVAVFNIFRGRQYTLERAELETLCLHLCAGELRVGDEAKWVLGQDPELVIDTLWRIGFLRAYAVGGVKARRRSGSSYLGPHQVSSLNLRSIYRFQVHPMFRAALGLKEPKERLGGDEE